MISFFCNYDFYFTGFSRDLFGAFEPILANLLQIEIQLTDSKVDIHYENSVIADSEKFSQLKSILTESCSPLINFISDEIEQPNYLHKDSTFPLQVFVERFLL